MRVTQLEHALDMCRSELEGHVSRVGEAVQLHKSEVEELKKQVRWSVWLPDCGTATASNVISQHFSVLTRFTCNSYFLLFSRFLFFPLLPLLSFIPSFFPLFLLFSLLSSLSHFLPPFSLFILPSYPLLSSPFLSSSLFSPPPSSLLPPLLPLLLPLFSPLSSPPSPPSSLLRSTCYPQSSLKHNNNYHRRRT